MLHYRLANSGLVSLNRATVFGTRHVFGREACQTQRLSPSTTLLPSAVYTRRCPDLDSCLGDINCETLGVSSRLFSFGFVFASGDLASMILQKNTENSVIVYSRTWCPFCSDVKQLLDAYNAGAKFVELDNIVEGDDIQDTLQTMTGSATVPQVFIGGQFIGGFDETFELHQEGTLQGRLESAGVKVE